MAKIWFVGQDTTIPRVKSLKWCIENLRYRQAKWLAPLGSPPKFDKGSPLDNFATQHIVLEVDEQDVTSVADKEWRKTGYYELVGLSPDEAVQRLQK